jgi:hypothetical protein
MFRLLTIYLKPVLPILAEKAETFFEWRIQLGFATNGTDRPRYQ